MTPNDILKGAAEIIKQRGLNKGGYIDLSSGCVCAAGALRLAADGVVEPLTGGIRVPVEHIGHVQDAKQKLMKHLDSQFTTLRADDCDIAVFNDSQSTSQQDIIEALLAAVDEELPETVSW